MKTSGAIAGMALAAMVLAACGGGTGAGNAPDNTQDGAAAEAKTIKLVAAE